MAHGRKRQGHSTRSIRADRPRALAWVTGGFVCLASVLPATVAGAQTVVRPAQAGVSGPTLNAALARLARDPRDLAALIDAGNAALMMGDVDAAVGFFARADQLSPNNMRVKAGLAGALVRSENPYDAIPLFAEADRAGGLDPLLASDRGLAYDLVGDTASAQRYYRQALSTHATEETVRRLAISQAIAGDRAGMEATLSPLLQRQDKAAWRARAFGLAILGRPEEGVAIANQTMPTDLANGIAPYLRYMPRLTRAQQAAAANLGRFPRASEIGRDDPRVALYAPPTRVAGVDAGLVPAGEPLGRSRGRQQERRSAASAPAASAAPRVVAPRVAPPEPAPARAVSAPPALAQAALPVTSAQVPVRSAQPAAIVASPSPAARPALAGAGGFDLARVGQGGAVAAAPVREAVAASVSSPTAQPVATSPVAAPVSAQPVPARPAPRPRNLAVAFADLAVVPKAPAAPAPGAVDVRKLAEARAKADAVRAKADAARLQAAKESAKPKEPPKPAHPSRIWVQVGTGRDVGALGFTWRGLVKDNAALFKGQSPAISDWGRTNRLLAGPFASEAAADAFLAKAKKAGLDAFVWTSPAGQVVDALPAK